jgi:hypothetical protein
MSIQFSGKTSTDFAWEICLFEKIRSWKDGFTFFTLLFEYERYLADHNPKFEFELVLCNWRLISFIHYCVWHIDNKNSPYWKSLHASIHSHTGFYKGYKLYKFYSLGDENKVHDFYLPEGFNRPYEGSSYFEFSGTPEEALKVLKNNNIPTVEGNEL